MTFPTSTRPALEAIYESLTLVTGRTRALADDRLFRRAPAAQRGEAGNEAEAIKLGRVCFVYFRDLSAAPQPEVAPGDRLRYSGICEIVRRYRAGNDLFSAESERAYVTATDDSHLVRAALCWPGALTLTLAGEETGIDGGALTSIGHRVIGPTRAEQRGFVACVDQFPISLTLRME